MISEALDIQRIRQYFNSAVVTTKNARLAADVGVWRDEAMGYELLGSMGSHGGTVSMGSEQMQ